ncbi:MAG: hypothetical protein R3297_06905, partial [Desulfobulbales bacterium]|nr:hypothetical protein [Desulfobulbales bacterium]
QKHSLGNTAAAIPILDLYTGKKLYLDQTWQSEQGLKRAASASLRFTWELTAPSYYNGRKYTGNDLPLVIIASEPILQPPPVAAAEDHRYKLLRVFSKTTGIYRYQTHVAVFAPL